MTSPQGAHDLFEGFGGQFRQLYAKLLELQSKAAETTPLVLKELLDNALDAGASMISVELKPTEIIVRDDGSGLNDYMPSTDMDELIKHWADLEAQRVAPDSDVRKLISAGGKASFHWMTINVAFSGKTPESGEDIQGTRGVGFQAVRGIANRVEILSRPSADIAIDTPATNRMVLPTLEQVIQGTINPLIERVNTPLRDYRQQYMSQGTVVTLADLKPGTMIRVQTLIGFIQERYGLWIKQGVKFVVVEPNGAATTVPPPKYPGYPILAKTLQLPGGGVQFSLELHYDPQGRKLRPTIRWKGADRNPITDIEDLKIPLFEGGKVPGFIEWSDVSEREAPWNDKKTVPLASLTREQWVRAILHVVPEAEERIKEIEDRAREQRIERTVQAAADQTLEAARDLEAFRDLVVETTITERRQRAQGTKPKKKRTSQPSAPNTKLIAIVFDEHNHGVPDVSIQLIKEGKLDSELETGNSGRVSFGTPEEVRYTIKMVTPPGMQVKDGVDEYTFTIRPRLPGYIAIFRVITGKPDPGMRRVPRITAYLHALSDPLLRWTTERLGTAGLFEINSEAPEVKAALESGDTRLLNILTIQFTSAGLAAFAHADQPPVVQHQHGSELFAHVLSQMDLSKRTG